MTEVRGFGWEQVLETGGALSGYSRFPEAPSLPPDVQKRFEHPGNGITYQFPYPKLLSYEYNFRLDEYSILS
jgi:hypothetical protein